MGADKNIAQEMRRDTRRSWRVMRNVAASLCAAIVALIGFCISNSAFGPGDPSLKITIFQVRLGEYLAEANFDKFDVGQHEIEDANWRGGLADSKPDELQEAHDALILAYSELNGKNQKHAQEVFHQAMADYTRQLGSHAVYTWDDPNGFVGWTITSHVLGESIATAAASAIAGWFVGWLFMVGAAFVWWFLTDRVYDIARAVKGDAVVSPGVSMTRPAPISSSTEPEIEKPEHVPVLEGAGHWIKTPLSETQLPGAIDTPPNQVQMASKSGNPSLKTQALELFVPRGRIGRREWVLRFLAIPGFLAVVFCIIFPIGYVLIIKILPQEYWTTVLASSIWLFVLLALYLQIVNMIKRLHDFNFNAWWTCIVLPLAFVFGIALIPLLVIPGTDGENRFGPSTVVKQPELRPAPVSSAARSR